MSAMFVAPSATPRRRRPRPFPWAAPPERAAPPCRTAPLPDGAAPSRGAIRPHERGCGRRRRRGRGRRRGRRRKHKRGRLITVSLFFSFALSAHVLSTATAFATTAALTGLIVAAVCVTRSVATMVPAVLVLPGRGVRACAVYRASSPRTLASTATHHNATGKESL